MTNSDKLLEKIIERVNKSGDLFDLTITIRGAMMTGRLVPRSTWLGENIGFLEKAAVASGFVDDFAGEGGAFDTPEYLHLSDAKVFLELGHPLPAGTGLVRIPITSVDSWAIGRMDPKPVE